MMILSPWNIYVMILENPYDSLVLHMISLLLTTKYWQVINLMSLACRHLQMAMTLKKIPKIANAPKIEPSKLDCRVPKYKQHSQ